MNKIRLSKSGIEYLDFMWGIWSGCRNIQRGICLVERCWAKGLACHYPKIYPNDFEPTFYPEAIDSPKYLKKPSRIGVGWVGDVIGYCDRASERSLIMQTILQCPQHTFVFLTKNPDKLSKWRFPENCWVGVTTTGFDGNSMLEDIFRNVHAKVKFVSIEPLLDYSPMDFRWVDLVIVGRQTPISAKTQPRIEWIKDIVDLAPKAGKLVFLKNNLKSLLTLPEQSWAYIGRSGNYHIRQERPI